MDWPKGIWRIFLILLVAIPAVCTIVIFFFSHETFTEQVFSNYHNPEKLEKFRSTLLTQERFTLLRFCLIFLTTICLIIGIAAWNRHQQVFLLWHRIRNYSFHTIKQAREFWWHLPAIERYITLCLFAVIIISRVYFLYQVPFHIDERFTYLYFVSKGMGVSMAYYPNPNNHIFFTILCTIISAFIDDPWLVMKIPAFLMGFVLVVVYWAVIRSFFDLTITLLATALFAFSAGVWYYGLQGRGYSLLMICLLIAIRSVFTILQIKKNRFTPFFWLWLSSVLGFYTIPIFIYPFTGIMLFAGIYLLTQKEYASFLRLCFCTVCILTSAFLLYLPVFVFNGWNAISGNSWVVAMPWDAFIADIPAHLLSMADNMWGYLPFGQWLLLLTIVYCIIILIRKAHSSHRRKWVYLFLICLLSLLVISVGQRILLFQRLILYLSVFQYLILALLLIDIVSWLIQKPVYRLYILTGISAFYISFNSFQFYRDTAPEKFDLYDSFDNISSLLYQKQADIIFVNMYEYALCIRFQYETNGKPIDLDSQQTESGKEYRYLVIHKEYAVPEQISLANYKVIYSDAEAVVYEKVSL
ncbi:hypothetical protein GXP67_23340 [Rhodocytophaga rosea]|uniref:Glycosyltransferase RgtA/B/C/D-like domain-containing protein n=1 Tax=Rhodocytophaga rosea TaxID=2704465 RepID=A0A6C0GP12_9BACT|nr:hypothetical protein [Rhodocytophaga rosea]QHT69363.1 hypothetical protein GXP67_23340 [Rhodocytophaga rosea]